MSMTRRTTMSTGLAAGAAFLSRPGLAAAKRLNILSHRVHQTVLTTGGGGDLTAAWRAANDTDIAWTTLDIAPLQDRLLREASLSETDFGVGYLLNSRATPDAASLLEPLGPYQERLPIEAFEDLAPGLVEAMRVKGKLVAIPVRHATNALFYNEALLEQQGIAAPPQTLEELVEQAKRLTFRPADGPPVTGLVLAAELAAFPVMFARANGGDFITSDFVVIPNPEAMTKALATMRELFAARALPRSYATTKNDDQVTFLQQGRAAFTILPFARYAQANRPDQSRFPGRIKAVEFPVAEALRGKLEMAPVVEFWAMAIPKSARDKELAWSFIQGMSAKTATLGAAINGNGPVRISTYVEPEFAKGQPLAAIEAASLKRARPPFPAFPEAARAEAVFVEEVQLAVLGQKEPAEAVAATIERVKPLLPA